MINKKFGKLVNYVIVYAPSNLIYNGILHSNPDASTYLAAGWKRIVDEVPDVEDGYIAQPINLIETETEITRKYEVYEQSNDSVVVSKAKIASTVDQIGKTSEFMTWINSKAQYMTWWFDGSPTIPYDSVVNGVDMSSLITALDIKQDQISSLIEQCKED